MSIRIAVLAPEDLSKRKTYPIKVYAQAKLLSKFGQVTLFGYNVTHADEYTTVDLTKISEFSHSFKKSIRVYASLFSSILKSRFDYVFIPTVFNTLFPVLFIASKLSSSTIIYDFRDSIFHTVTGMKKQVLKRSGNKLMSKFVLTFSSFIDKLLLQLSDYVFTISPSLVNYAITKGKKSSEKVFLYYSFIPEMPKEIDLEDLPDSLKNGIKQGKIILFYFGNIQPQIRGIEAVFEAYVKANNFEILIVLLGEIQEEKYWKDLVKKLKIEEHVIFLKARPRPEALGLIKYFDYSFLGPNNPENALPTKIFECLSMRKKIIFPNHMKDVLKVVKNNGIPYKTSNELVTIIQNLSKPHKKNEEPPLEFKSMEDMMEPALAEIFKL